MPKTVRVLDQNVDIVAYKGQRVVTFAMINHLHQRPAGTAGRAFRDNRDRYE